jgi:hypothetical protein
MHTINRYSKLFTRTCLILVYLSFYLVQLNVHFGVTPVRSIFSGDFVSQNSVKGSHSTIEKSKHKDSKSAGFRLNKRFHPEYLSTAPELLQDLVRLSFRIQIVLLNDEQPLTSFSFNAPSLRGPPVVV